MRLWTSASRSSGRSSTTGYATPCPLPVRQVAQRRSSVGDTRGVNAVHGRGADLLVSEAKGLGITGGFRQDVHDLLCRHPELVSRAARLILTEHFPPSIHQDILDAVRLAADAPSHGLDEPMPRRGRKVREYTPRDRRFRKRVLEAYDERCAVCEYDIRFGDRLLGLEAAHIRWHSHDGRDVVPNGLALCGVHHKALDLGAMGLEGKGGGFRILVSERVRGRSPAARRLVGLRGRAIRLPVRAKDVPDRGFVEWHRGRCFGGEGGGGVVVKAPVAVNFTLHCDNSALPSKRDSGPFATTRSRLDMASRDRMALPLLSRLRLASGSASTSERLLGRAGSGCCTSYQTLRQGIRVPDRSRR